MLFLEGKAAALYERFRVFRTGIQKRMGAFPVSISIVYLPALRVSHTGYAYPDGTGTATGAVPAGVGRSLRQILVVSSSLEHNLSTDNGDSDSPLSSTISLQL